VLLAVVVGAVMFLQRETGANLRSEIVLLREEHGEMARLKAERDRLKAAQMPAAELAQLRADRAALMQIRSELDAMKARADQMARVGEMPAAVKMPPAEKSGPVGEESANATPSGSVSVMPIALAMNGTLSLDGNVVDLNELKARWSLLPKDTLVDVRMTPESGARSEDVKGNVERLMALGRELGLKVNLRLEGAVTTAPGR